MKKLICIICIVFTIFIHSSVFALEEDTSFSMQNDSFSRSDYIRLFESQNVAIPNGALFGPSIAETKDGNLFTVAKMTVINDDSVSDCFLYMYTKTDEGLIEALPLEEAVDEIIYRTERSLLNTQTKTIYSVNITAQYDKRYNTSSGYYEYKPKKMSFVSSSTQNVKVNYYIYGWKTGTTTQMGHSVLRAEYPAYQGQLYTKTNQCAYYIQPLYRYHQLVVTVASHDVAILYLNGQNGYDDN